MIISSSIQKAIFIDSKAEAQNLSKLFVVVIQSLSGVWLSVTPWTVAHQVPLSMGILQARILEWIAMPSSRGSSQPRDHTQVSHIAGRFFTIWATRKPKNTGVGSLFLLQEIFPTQGSNPGLPHCRQILYCLSHQGSPVVLVNLSAIIFLKHGPYSAQMKKVLKWSPGAHRVHILSQDT